jgi:hypothetical protein
MLLQTYLIHRRLSFIYFYPTNQPYAFVVAMNNKAEEKKDIKSATNCFLASCGGLKKFYLKEFGVLVFIL